MKCGPLPATFLQTTPNPDTILCRLSLFDLHVLVRTKDNQLQFALLSMREESYYATRKISLHFCRVHNNVIYNRG